LQRFRLNLHACNSLLMSDGRCRYSALWSQSLRCILAAQSVPSERRVRRIEQRSNKREQRDGHAGISPLPYPPWYCCPTLSPALSCPAQKIVCDLCASGGFAGGPVIGLTMLANETNKESVTPAALVRTSRIDHLTRTKKTKNAKVSIKVM
jgi:hypothetical protein